MKTPSISSGIPTKLTALLGMSSPTYVIIPPPPNVLPLLNGCFHDQPGNCIDLFERVSSLSVSRKTRISRLFVISMRESLIFFGILSISKLPRVVMLLFFTRHDLKGVKAFLLFLLFCYCLNQHCLPYLLILNQKKGRYCP